MTVGQDVEGAKRQLRERQGETFSLDDVVELLIEATNKAANAAEDSVESV
jgi:hypothetical protein